MATPTAKQVLAGREIIRLSAGRRVTKIICGRCGRVTDKHFAAYVGRFDLRTREKVGAFEENEYAIHLGTCQSCRRKPGGWKVADFFDSLES